MIGGIVQTISPIVESILSLVGKFLENILEYIGDLLDAFSGIITFLTGVFSGDWEKAWEGIKDTGLGLWNALLDGIKSIVKKDVSRISVVGYGISSRDDIVEKIIDIANKNSLEIFNIDISKTKISVVFKEMVKDEIIEELHDILIK